MRKLRVKGSELPRVTNKISVENHSSVGGKTKRRQGSRVEDQNIQGYRTTGLYRAQGTSQTVDRYDFVLKGCFKVNQVLQEAAQKYAYV